MEMGVNTIVVALFLVFVQAYPKDIKFYDLKSNAISYEDAQKLSSLIITFEADRQYKIQLQNNTLNLSNVKSNICSYSAKLFDQPSYGIFNLCDLTAKIYTNDRYIEIKDNITITNQENDVDDDKMEDNEEDSKYMKIFIINDNNRVKHYGSEINNNTIEVYKVAKNIIEREDWGKYKIKLVLNGILNIVNGNYDDVKEKTQSAEQIDSDDALYSTNDEDRESFTEKHNKGLGKRREIKTKSESDVQTRDKDKEKRIENVIKEPENVSEDVTKEKGPHTIDIKEIINDFRERTIEHAESNLKNNWKAPCIKLMYDNNKAFNTKEVNILDPETERKLRDLAINDTTSEISSYKLPKSTNLGFIKIEHVQQSTKDDAERSSKTLKRFADIFENIRNHQKDADSLLAGSNLVIMLTTKKDRANIEGMTFIGGACSSNDAFSIIKLRPSDSNFYHGKVTAHEILHSLDARHDVECGEGYLMEEQGCTTCMEDDRRISKCTIKQVTSFIDRQNPKCFRMNNLCGNGVIDEGEECDSGLPFGSDCCTANCKLRKNCECDDRNGTCCFECKLLPKNGTCKNTTSTMNDNSCIKEYLCDGQTANCHQIYKKDGESCSGGFCKNGICQNREVFCDRIDRKFDSSREKANECKLVCVDENLRSSIMGTVGKDEVIPLSLPDGMPCMIDNISGSCYNGECKPKPSPKNYLLPLAFIAAILFSSSLILLFLL